MGSVRRRPMRSVLTSFVSSVALLSAMSPARSQEVAETGGLEEITVTARRVSENIIDAPLSITALTASDLAAKGVQDRYSLNLFTPGFEMATQNTSNATRLINTYTMRGLGAINLFWNGTPLNGGDIPELLDLDRVEVLRGPQNAYFGRSTFSGAVNFISADPTFDRHGYFEADAATYGSYDVKAAVSDAILPNILAGRIAVDDHTVGGQYTNYGYGGTLGTEKTYAGTASFLFTPSDNFKMKLYGAYWADRDGPNATTYYQPPYDYNCNAGKAPAGTNNFICGAIKSAPADRISTFTQFTQAMLNPIEALATTNTVGPNYINASGMRRDGEIAQLFADYTLPNNWMLSAIGAYDRNEAGQIQDFGAVYYPLLYGAGATNYNPSLTTYLLSDDYGEFRVTSDQKERLRGLVGVSYVYSQQYIQSVVNKNGIISVSFPPTDIYSRTLGIFGSLSYDIMSNLTATVEGRWQRDEVGRNTIGVQNPYEYTKSFVPRALLEYHFTKDAQVYASFSEGTLPSALNTGFTSLPAYAQAQVAANYAVPAVTPENKLYNYELGVKGNFFNNTLQILSDVYYAQWRDRTIAAALLYTNLQGVLAQANVNVPSGGVNAAGTEWEVTWLASKNLTFNATLAYNWTHLTQTYCASCLQVTGNADPVGNSYARFPVMTAVLAATYTHAAFAEYDYFLHIDAAYKGKEYADESNLTWLAPQVVTNANIGLQDKRWKFEIYGINILNNKVPQQIAETTQQLNGLPTITTTPAIKPEFGARVHMAF